MEVTKVSDYIALQVNRMSDSRVKPLMDAIEAECLRKVANDSRKADLDKDSAECDKRIAEYRNRLSEAQRFVESFRQTLTDSTANAVS